MDKKKGVIIAVVLLLLLMVGTFAFQRDDEQKYDGEPDSGIQDDGQDGNDDNDPATTDPTTPTEEEGNTDDELEGTQTVNGGGNGGQNGNFVNTDPDNNQNGQGGNNDNGNVPSLELSTEKLEASVASGNDVLTTTNSVDTTLNELLSKLEKAVSEGEEIISNPTTQTAIDEKQEEIDNLLKQIQDYLDDAYARAEAAVELSEKENTKENLDNATELVNLLPDGERKDALLDRIKDTTAPLITLNGDSPMTLEAGVDTYEELGATVTDNVDETVTDLQPDLINYSIGGVFNGPVENVDTTKVGTYKIVYKYTDQAGNVAVDANRADHDYVMRVVNVVDTIAPEYETLRLLRIEPDYSTFAKNGDKIRVLVDFKEELAVLPKLKINNEVEVNFRFSGYREDSNTYLYMADYTIPTDESELAEGELSILVYGYADSSNNIGEDLDNSKINHDTQNMVIYDRTAPTYNFTNGNTFREKEVVVTDEYFDHMTIYNYATGETTTIQENTWMMNSGNTMYKLTAYDKAGNYKEIWIYHDDSVAAFEGTGKIGGEDTEFTDGGIYQSLSLRVSDNDLISVVQELNGEKTTLASYTWENNPEYVDFEFTEEGTYTITATDRAGNTSYVIFTIDTTPADAIHEAVNILEVGEPNEQSEYYVTTGDTVQVYARFDEVLGGNPTFTLINNNQEYVIPTEDVIVTGPNDEGKYTYKINYEVKADEMDEGEITLKISNIYDRAGNKTEDITKPTNGHRVYIDRVNPEILSLTQEYEDKQDGRIKVTIVTSEEIFGDEVHSTAWRKVGENTYVNYFYETKEVTINFTDIAGNSGNYRFTVDKTAPEILSLTQEYEDKQDGRIKVTIVTSEEIFGDEVHSTAWRKVGENTYVNYFYETKEVTINFTDAVGNPATYTFTVDKTAPVYSAMGIFNWTNDKNNEDLTYATKDEHIRLYVAFPEMLGTNPKVDIYGQDGTVTTLDMAYSEAAKFYFVEFDTTDELNLPQGKINYRIYGYKDETGNVGVDLTQDNTTSKEYPYVIYDSVAPVYSSLGITDLDEFKDEVGKLYVKNGDTVRVLVYFDEKLAVEPTVKIGNKEFKSTYREESSKNQPAYYADVKITDELGLTDGVINFEVYGYSDISGNTGKVLTNEDINMSSYPSVTLDNTTPEALSVIFHSTNGNDIQKAMPGDKLCLYLLVNEELKFNPTFTVNGVEYKVNQTEVTNVGNYKYAVVYDIPSDTQDGEMTFEISNIVDLAGNSIDTLTNEDAIEGKSTIDYDSTLPEISVLGITGFFNEAEDADPHYIKTGEKVRILAYYNEKLSVSPIVKIGDKEFQAFYTEDSSDVENNLYAYYADIKITDDLNLADGEIMFSIYGYKDLVGNEGKTYTNEDITYGEDEFSYVILDNVAPSFNVASSTHDAKAMNIVITEDNFDYAVIINQDTGKKETTSDKEFAISDEATYHIYAYDKAENVAELWVAIDKNAPSVIVTGTGENNKFTSDVVVDASDKFLTEVKINDTIYTRDDFSFDSRNENGKFSIRLTDEKDYTIVAKDKFGHETKVEFSIDKSAPIVTLKDGDMNVEINTEFVDPGYTVTDNLDKDLEINTIVYYSKDGADGTWTDAKDNKVDTSVLGHYAIWYSATDSSGNVSDSVRRLVVVQDTTKPLVTLNGTDMTVEVNDEFADPGVTITDNSGEELTANIKVYYSETGADGTWTDAKDNKVDTTVLGHYAIWYSATDSSGNVSDSVRRLVVVEDSIAPIVAFPNTHGEPEAYKSWKTLTITITERELSEVYYTWANTNKYVSATTLVPDENIINNGDGTYTVKVPTVDGRNRLNIKAIDAVGNVTEVYSTQGAYNIDTTAPKAIGLRMTGGEVVDENGEKVWYVSKDDKIYFYVEFAEELAVSPKLKINDAIVVDFNNGLYKDDRYIYAAIYTVKEDDALQDGTLAIEVYGYADQAGNVGQALKNEDITLPSQKNIVVDKTAPTFNIMDGMVTNDNVLVEVADTNYTYTSITNVTSTNQTNTRFTLESTGVYTLVAYDKAGNSTTITLTIDKVNPEIILPEGVIGLNKNEKHIEAGSTLSLEGLVQAKDNLDENVKLELKYVTFYAPSGLKEDNIYNYDFSNGIDTKKVGRYNLDYVATDAAGNVAKKTLLIMISDTTKPVISIDRTVELNVGDKFVEDIDSKISDNSDDTLKVEIYPVNGIEVDTTQAGTYQINYKISDTSGNYEVATRTVIVK